MNSIDRLEQDWQQEVRQSRIRIKPDQQSDLPAVGLTVWALIEALAAGRSESHLRSAYPGLTNADIRACQLFTYLRTVGRL